MSKEVIGPLVSSDDEPASESLDGSHALGTRPDGDQPLRAQARAPIANQLFDTETAQPNDAVPRGALAVGSQIGGYGLVSVLGEGGMGVVWSAKDPMLDRLIAINGLRVFEPTCHSRANSEARVRTRLDTRRSYRTSDTKRHREQACRYERTRT